MGLTPSKYGSGRDCKKCPICGMKLSGRGAYTKCYACTKKIAKDVETEFKENIGHHMTEAILAAGSDKFIDVVAKGQKQLDELDAEKENDQEP